MNLDFKRYVVAASHLTLPVGSVIALPPEDIARHFHLLRYVEGRHGWFETRAGIDLLRGQEFLFAGELPLNLVQEVLPVGNPPVVENDNGDDSDDEDEDDGDPVIPVSPVPVPSAPPPPVEEETGPDSQDGAPDEPAPTDQQESVVNPDAPPSAARARRRS